MLHSFGIRTQGFRIEGIDESTELWWTTERGCFKGQQENSIFKYKIMLNQK